MPVYHDVRKAAQIAPLGDLFHAEVAYAEAHKDAVRLEKAFRAARTALALPSIDCDYGSLLAAEESARVAYSTANARFQSALRQVEALRVVAPKAPGFGECDGDVLCFWERLCMKRVRWDVFIGCVPDALQAFGHPFSNGTLRIRSSPRSDNAISAPSYCWAYFAKNCLCEADFSTLLYILSSHTGES